MSVDGRVPTRTTGLGLALSIQRRDRPVGCSLQWGLLLKAPGGVPEFPFASPAISAAGASATAAVALGRDDGSSIGDG